MLQIISFFFIFTTLLSFVHKKKPIQIYKKTVFNNDNNKCFLNTT